MNVDKNNDRTTVTSKYFSNELVMDESLSDFKEKKSFVGPRKVQRVHKPRKAKRLKGQKDIRTVLNKKNELLSYSKEFDKVCKLSGIDVDPEQLQLAVALSKSLQTEEKTESESSQSTSSQERSGKIRTTLQEYGFKVPENKIINKKKRVKKHRKAYKLHLTSDTEKQQTISDKYSQVLFNCLESNLQNCNTLVDTASQLYNICTNVPYNDLKNNNLLYVPGLIEQSPNSIGSLLKNWSDIPGRPVSPELTENLCINFVDIVFSQEELDIVLSGKITSTKEIFRKKHFDTADDKMKDHIQISNSSQSKYDEDLVIQPECNKSNIIKIENPAKEQLTATQQVRSSSPDLFGDDDEVSLINESKTDVKIQKSNFQIESSSIFMDLTECQTHNDVKIENSQPSSQLSQKYDLTKRKSNDFMEITECVATLSQPIVNKIDLTQDSNHVTTINVVLKDVVDTFDLTQSSPEDLPEVLITGKENTSADDTIILKDEELNLEEDLSTAKEEDNPIEPCVDLTDSVGFDNVSDQEDADREKSFDEFTHNHSDDDVKIENFAQNIDITQTESCEIATNSASNIISTNLGKIDNVSIDYDDIFDEMVSNVKSNSMKSIVYDLSDEETDRISCNSDLVTISSQNSQAFEISDNELNYSIQKSKLEMNFDVGGLSVLDNGLLANDSKKIMRNSVNDESLPAVDIKGSSKITDTMSFIKASTSKTTPKKAIAVLVETPTNNNFTIKTTNVTPMQDYGSMSTPVRNSELDKYGLKPFKRKRAIQLLTHLYNQTHPIMESCEDHSPSKRPKHDTDLHDTKVPSPRKLTKSPKKSPRKCVVNTHENDLFQITNELLNVKEILCDEEDWVFQKREKAKTHSCRVPLHIAFHNYVSCRRRLYEAILRYEPIDIDTVHKGLVANGFRYDPKDLLRFMDKKCITVKTADNNVRNRKS